MPRTFIHSTLLVPLKKEELAWAAGFFDGEGCVSARERDDSAKIEINIGQANSPETLIRFKNAVGGIGKIGGPYPPKRNSNHSPYFKYWATSFERVQFIAGCLWPFLCSVKRGQFYDTLDFYLWELRKGSA